MDELSTREVIERNIDSDTYFTPDYLDSRRWASYRVLIREIVRLCPKNILEIGPGNKIVSSICTALGFTIHTLDINPTVKPDIVGSASALPIKAGSIDLIVAQQVLEHIPFERFAGIMEDISMIAQCAIISLPHVSLHLTLGAKLPMLKWYTLCITLPIACGRIGEPHCWELGMNVKAREVRRCFMDAGFNIVRSLRTAEHPYHHFFVLRKPVQGAGSS